MNPHPVLTALLPYLSKWERRPFYSKSVTSTGTRLLRRSTTLA